MAGQWCPQVMVTSTSSAAGTRQAGGLPRVTWRPALDSGAQMHLAVGSPPVTLAAYAPKMGVMPAPSSQASARRMLAHAECAAPGTVY